MEERNLIEIINETLNDPKFLASDSYIAAQLEGNWLVNVAFQMGPNCNLKCSHCYGDYGPHRKGLPSKELADKVIGDLADGGISDITLTDGEPIREENKGVLGSFAEISQRYPVHIITNATFARTLNQSINWFNFLKSKGWDISRGNSLLVSSGLMYDVSWKNYAHLAFAMHNVFSNTPLDNHLTFAYYSSGDISKAESNLLNKICSALYTAFQERGHPKITTDENIPSFRFCTHVDFGEGFNFRIDVRDYDPQGRGNCFNSHLDKDFPLKRYDPLTMGFSPDTLGAAIVSSSGDVSFGNSLSCFASGRNYGNVMKESLRTIKKRIYADSAYRAFRLGGVRFMYFLAREQDPNFIVQGRIRCDVCTDLFGNLPLLNRIKSTLEGKGVIETYKRYLEVAGIPQIN